MFIVLHTLDIIIIISLLRSLKSANVYTFFLYELYFPTVSCTGNDGNTGDGATPGTCPYGKMCHADGICKG